MAEYPVFMYGVPAGVPVGNHLHRRYIPIPPTEDPSAGAIRMVSCSWKLAAHNIGLVVGDCAPKEYCNAIQYCINRVKKGGAVSAPYHRSWSTFRWMLSCALACSARKGAEHNKD